MITLDTKNICTFISKLKALKIVLNKFTYNNNFYNKEIDEIIYSIHIIINENNSDYNKK